LSLTREPTPNEPRHDKTNEIRLRPAWIQTSLRIRWSQTHYVGFVMTRLK
jgi:hypothetical protein